MLITKLVYLLLLINLTLARYAFVPKFYGQDSAVIVDTDKTLPPTAFDTQNARRYYHRFPTYQIIQPMKPWQRQPNEIAAIKSTTTTSTTTTTTKKPRNYIDEFPRDLLQIAQTKLGLKRLDEIPSISELGELLGTDTADETISYIRQLTSSDQGVALMKAYMESADYTDTDSTSNADEDADDNDDDEDEAVIDVAAATADLTVVPNDDDFRTDIDAAATSTTDSKPQAGFFERIASYLNIYNILPQKEVRRQAAIMAANPQAQKSLSTLPNSLQTQMLNNQKPYLIRKPLPYHYPIPLRPLVLSNANAKSNENLDKVPNDALQPKPAINTPKILIPAQLQQLSKMANIPPKKLELFLQSKPKLAELAKRMSNISLSNGSNNAVDNQLMSAIKKALEQDDDLRRLLSETDTLK